MPDQKTIVFAGGTLKAKQGVQGKVQGVANRGDLFSPPGFPTPVIVAMEGVEIGSKTPLMLDHRNEVSALAGSVIARVRNGQLVVDGQLSQSEAGQEAQQHLVEGTPLELSVGLVIEEAHTLSAGETVEANGRSIHLESETLLVTASRLQEISIVPLGAADGTSLRLVASKASEMPDTKTKTADPVKLVLDNTDFANEAIEIKATTRAEVMAAHGDNAADILTAIAPDLEENGRLLKARQNAAELKAMRAARPDARNFNIRASGPAVGVDPATVAEAAFLNRAGKLSIVEKEHPNNPALLQAARDAGRTMDSCFTNAIRATGQTPSTNFNTRMEQAFSPNAVIQANAGPVSTTSVAGVLSNVNNKIGLQEFMYAAATWRTIASIRDTKDFKENTLLQVEGDTLYEKTGPGSEAKHGTLSERVNKLTCSEYMKVLTLTRQQVKNDDANLLDMAGILGRSGARSVSKLAYEVWLADTGYFDAANSNLIDNLLDIDGLSAAIVALRTQTDSYGETLDLVPVNLLVPPELEAAGRQLLQSIEVSRVSTGDNLATGNPWSGISLALQVEARLSNPSYAGSSATAWYLTVGPNDMAPLVVGFVDGVQAPQITQFSPNDFVDRTLFSARGLLDYGCCLGDPKGAVKSTGDAA